VKQSIRPRHLGIAALTTLCLTATGPATASPAPAEGLGMPYADAPQHQYTVETQSMRGDTYVCRDLKLRVIRGHLTEINDADLRDGVAHIFTSRIWGGGVRLRGSDGRIYHASSVTAAWFVLRAPDFETPVHGLEVNQVMFRGGPEKSPGWIRERIKWVDKHDTDTVKGPCTFGD
jgi:hypothetical protein